MTLNDLVSCGQFFDRPEGFGGGQFLARTKWAKDRKVYQSTIPAVIKISIAIE